MAKISAGILPYRFAASNELQVLLVHPGGPFWAKKDEGSWSLAKGEADESEEDLLAVALREFGEETGFEVRGELIALEPVKQPSRKVIHAWAVEQDFDVAKFKSNEFEMEWPRKSGRVQSFPEVDAVEWFNIPTALRKSLKGQVPLVQQLVDHLDYDASQDRSIDQDGQSSLFD